jgi:protein O-mannosyl-transferase
MGYSILVLYGVQLLYDRMTKMRRIIQASGVLLLCFFCLKTVDRNQDWFSRETLLKWVVSFVHVDAWLLTAYIVLSLSLPPHQKKNRSGLRVLPHNAKMHYNYANFLRDTSETNSAKYHYRKALKLWPNYPSAWNNLGTLIDDDIDLQEQHFLAAIRFSNRHLNAHFNLGQLYRYV